MMAPTELLEVVWGFFLVRVRDNLFDSMRDRELIVYGDFVVLQWQVHLVAVQSNLDVKHCTVATSTILVLMMVPTLFQKHLHRPRCMIIV